MILFPFLYIFASFRINNFLDFFVCLVFYLFRIKSTQILSKVSIFPQYFQTYQVLISILPPQRNISCDFPILLFQSELLIFFPQYTYVILLPHIIQRRDFLLSSLLVWLFSLSHVFLLLGVSSYFGWKKQYCRSWEKIFGSTFVLNCMLNIFSFFAFI